MTEENLEIDPLDEIFVESNEVASRKIVAEILKPLLTIDPKGNLDFLASYNKLTNQKKALVYLVVKKAMKMKGSIDEEFTLNSETSKSAMISENDANNAFSNTYKNLVENEKGKGYAIPDYKLNKVKEEILGNGKK